jgi:RNA polymerase sigma-70 factor (ECF subfamily)
MGAIDQAGAERAIAQLRSGAEVVELRRDVEVVLGVLATLPPNQQEVVRLRFMHELSYREIGEITDLSVSNVGYLLHVALTAIRVRLTPSTRTVAENERRG